MWDVITNMQGQEVRVRLRSPFHGWIGWKWKDASGPQKKVTGPLKVFNVEAPWIAAEMDFKTDKVGRENTLWIVGT